MAETKVSVLRPARSAFAGVPEAAADLARGRIVIVCDTDDREDEGDMVLAARFATPDAVNFLIREARGLISLALPGARCEELGLQTMGWRRDGRPVADFTVTVDARDGITTGISAADRARTIAVATDPTSSPEELVQPGHISPLRARDGGVLERLGRAEAAVDLARLAGLTPAAVTCEVLNEDGDTALVSDLIACGREHGLRLLSAHDLLAWRRRAEPLQDRTPSADKLAG